MLCPCCRDLEIMVGVDAVERPVILIGDKRKDGQQSPKETANRPICSKRSVAKPSVAVKATWRFLCRGFEAFHAQTIPLYLTNSLTRFFPTSLEQSLRSSCTSSGEPSASKRTRTPSP